MRLAAGRRLPSTPLPAPKGGACDLEPGVAWRAFGAYLYALCTRNPTRNPERWIWVRK